MSPPCICLRHNCCIELPLPCDKTVASFRAAAESNGSEIVIDSGRPSQFSKEEVATRALSRLGERNYGLLFNNCEHFVEWCETGVPRSTQSEVAMAPSCWVWPLAHSDCEDSANCCRWSGRRRRG
jgi:hypothetical protein